MGVVSIAHVREAGVELNVLARTVTAGVGRRRVASGQRVVVAAVGGVVVALLLIIVVGTTIRVVGPAVVAGAGEGGGRAGVSRVEMGELGGNTQCGAAAVVAGIEGGVIATGKGGVVATAIEVVVLSQGVVVVGAVVGVVSPA